MKNIVYILKEFGEVAHWVIRPASEDRGGNLSFPPIITWRYKKPSMEVADFFQKAVSSFRGTIAWEFSVINETCCLKPSRINEYSKSHGNLGGLAVARELMTLDPEFGKSANAELPLLVEHIQIHMEKAG